MPRPGPDKPLWWPRRILADVGALCGAVRALWVPCHILVDVRAVKPRWGAVWRSPNVGGQWVPVGVQ